jgi:hypothetical protein
MEGAPTPLPNPLEEQAGKDQRGSAWPALAVGTASEDTHSMRGQRDRVALRAGLANDVWN